MTYKEMNAGVMLLGAVVISVWVWLGASDMPGASVADVAGRLCWAIGASILFNIVAVIVFTILVSIAQGDTLKNERSDERDHAVAAKAMRNGYVVASVGGLVALIVWAMGYEMTTGIYLLFAGLMLAGATDAVSRLIYYRVN